MKSIILLVFIIFGTFQVQAQLLINGGYSASSNLDSFEKDMTRLNKVLFNNKGIVINANGANTTTVKLNDRGDFLRDSEGWLKLFPSQITGALPATKENVSQSISSLVKNSKSDVTIYFGDHGGPQGVALWGGSAFSRGDFLKSIKSAPTDIFIRSLDIHCYSGAMIFTNSNGPFSEQFPRNVCALGVALHDEMGHALTIGTNSLWPRFLNNENSLKTIHDKMMRDPEISSTPVLTSDYAAIYGAQLTCNTFENSKICDNSSDVSQMTEVALQFECAQCLGIFDSTESVSLHKFDTLYDQITSLMREVENKFYIENYPNRYSELKSAIEKRNRNFEAGSPNPDLSELMKATTNYELDLASLSSSPKFEWWVQTHADYIFAVMLDKKEQYGDLLNEISGPNHIKKQFDLIYISQRISNSYFNAEINRKKVFVESIKSCQNIIKNDLTPVEVKRRYENILFYYSLIFLYSAFS
jgi:hypothetical protein